MPYIFLPAATKANASHRRATNLHPHAADGTGCPRHFRAVNYDSTAPATTGKYEYDVAAQMLMPAGEFKSLRPRTRADFEAVADEFKVTTSAAIVRALRLDLIDNATAGAHLAELRAAFAQVPKQPRSTSKPVNAVRQYNGRELSRRMLRALDEGRLSTGDFCREVCPQQPRPGRHRRVPSGPAMNDTFYLVDNNVLGKLSSAQRRSAFFVTYCRVPDEVLHEAGPARAAGAQECRYPTTADVLRAVQTVMDARQSTPRHQAGQPPP